LSHALDRRLETATRLATEAGKLALSLAPPPGAASAGMKGHQDWITEADGAVEAFLKRELTAAFPEDGFQGEETGTAAHRAGAYPSASCKAAAPCSACCTPPCWARPSPPAMTVAPR